MEFQYRGLTGVLQRHKVTDEQIDQQIRRLQDQNPRIRLIEDRPTELGDEVVLDYAGFCDGNQFAGGTAENQTLVLGSGMFIPGFEEQLVDKVPGEQVLVNVTFPQQYHSQELAGKEAQFRCVIRQIREKTRYDLDDTFAREVGNCETFEQMRQVLGQSLQAYTDERGEMDLQDQLIRQAAQTLDLVITQEQLEAAVDEQMQTLQAQLGQQGLSLEMYCQFMNTTPEQLCKDSEETARSAIRIRAAVDQIVKLENLTADEQEIAEACQMICRQNNMTMEQLQPYYDEEFEQAVIRSVLTAKAMRLVRDAAEITEK